VIAIDKGWSRPPASLEIRPDDVHIWAAPLWELRLDWIQSLILSRDERQRAARLRSRQRQREFVAGRALLRVLLAAYTGTPAASVRIAYGRFGKPALEEPYGGPRLTFNASRSHGLALYAFGCGRQVGVDVERLQPRFPCDGIAQQFFCRAERVRLAKLYGSQLTRTFFDYWSAKEALLKARGDGLSGGLNDIDVHQLDENQVAVITEPTSRVWTVMRLEPKPDYAGAVAIEGTDATLHCWDLTLGELPSWTSGSGDVAAVLT
jgi:4'-phosphopantetheinyl transferase